MRSFPPAAAAIDANLAPARFVHDVSVFPSYVERSAGEERHTKKNIAKVLVSWTDTYDLFAIIFISYQAAIVALLAAHYNEITHSSFW